MWKTCLVSGIATSAIASYTTRDSFGGRMNRIQPSSLVASALNAHEVVIQHLRHERKSERQHLDSLKKGLEVKLQAKVETEKRNVA